MYGKHHGNSTQYYMQIYYTVRTVWLYLRKVHVAPSVSASRAYGTDERELSKLTVMRMRTLRLIARRGDGAMCVCKLMLTLPHMNVCCASLRSIWSINHNQ